MTSVLRRILPASSLKNEDHDSDYSVEYSFAMEYSGPPVSHDLPQVVPLDVRRIPTAKAAVASSALMMSNLSLPVVNPIAKKSSRSNTTLPELKRSTGRVYSRKSENFSGTAEIELAIADSGGGELSHAPQSSSSSGTLGFSDGLDDSNHLSESSDVEDLDTESKARASFDNNSSNPTTSNNSEIENQTDEISSQTNRAAVVTFRDLPPSSSNSASEETDHDESEMSPPRPSISSEDLKRGLCHKCGKKNRFAEKEVCIVCSANYCTKCVIRAMGSMPEGRKCITCIGYRIDESKRGSLGKSTRMLKKLLGDEAIKQIMSAEVACEVNQLPPHMISVNDKPLSLEELVMLQSCANPPKKLRPGKYWYDKVSGLWGKDGEKPCQIISPQLAVGYQISQTASNGNTNVMINNREVTKAELWMLQAAGIRCEGNPHFWVTADGSYQLEGMNYVMGKIWDKTRVRLVCAALSLPFPSDMANTGDENVDKDKEKTNSKNLEQNKLNKILLVGCDQSGTSTIFKQARILYNVPFSEDEKQNIKIMIQRNLYRYIVILLQGRQSFEEYHAKEIRRQSVDEPGPSGVDKNNIYSFSPKLEAFSNWLLQVLMSGNLEAIFPAATREYSPLVEELWKDKAFQAIYKRRNELHSLPRVANYFLDRAVEISKMDYEPSEMDILYAEGITSSNGVASMEFSFPKSSQDGYMESLDQNDTSISYQLIRVHASSLGENGKWLEMFEDVGLVIYSASLTAYDEYYEDTDGIITNKMLSIKNHFETIVTHPTLAEKNFLLILNKFDLLEEKIERVPLTVCDWFRDFNPVMKYHPHSANSNNNPPLAQKAFHYIAVEFKKLFGSITGRKLFVAQATGLEGYSIDQVMRYGKEILKWDDEKKAVSVNEWSTGLLHIFKFWLKE